MKYRMYHLVMYNISPIQQGIQSYHAGMEYALDYWTSAEFQEWLQVDKTVIILNGGTSNSNAFSEHFGTMDRYFNELQHNSIPCGAFREPDLNNALSSIAFLASEKVWDKEKYPDWETIVSDGAQEQLGLLGENDYIQNVIGKKDYWLRQFLSQFKLA